MHEVAFVAGERDRRDANDGWNGKPVPYELDAKALGGELRTSWFTVSAEWMVGRLARRLGFPAPRRATPPSHAAGRRVVGEGGEGGGEGGKG